MNPSSNIPVTFEDPALLTAYPHPSRLPYVSASGLTYLSPRSISKSFGYRTTIPATPSHLMPQCVIALATLPLHDNFSTDCLPTHLIKHAATFKPERRRQYLGCRILLTQLLAKITGHTQLPNIITRGNDRPVFEDPTLPDFNITHSQNVIMVALLNKNRMADASIGLDLEVVRPRSRFLKLAHYAFSTDEYLWLTQLPITQQNLAFWQLWTIREAILKMQGKGVWQMRQIQITPATKTISTDLCDALWVQSIQQENIFWSLATNRPLTHFELWQSDPQFSMLERLDLPVLHNTFSSKLK